MKIKLKDLKTLIENFLNQNNSLKEVSSPYAKDKRVATDDINKDIRNLYKFKKSSSKPEVMSTLQELFRNLVLFLRSNNQEIDSGDINKLSNALILVKKDLINSNLQYPYKNLLKGLKILDKNKREPEDEDGLSDEAIELINSEPAAKDDLDTIKSILGGLISAAQKESENPSKDNSNWLENPEESSEEPSEEESEEPPEASPIATQPEDDGWNKESIYKIDNIYKELDKNYHLRKNEKITLDKISLGAFNKLSTNTHISNLFFFDPPFFKTAEDAMSGLTKIHGRQWKDNKHGNDDVNVYFEETGWFDNIVFKDGYSDRYSQTNGKHTSLKKYTVAIDGFGNYNAIIGDYIAVKDPNDSKIYLMSIKRAKKEGFVKQI